jgi:hypothetical protein
MRNIDEAGRRFDPKIEIACVFAQSIRLMHGLIGAICESMPAPDPALP